MRSWKWFALVGLVVVVAGVVPTARDMNAEASPQVTFVKTIVGTDFHSLDYRFAAQFVPNSGGGVYLHLIPGTGGESPSTLYLEANVDIPGGARVTGVDVFYRDCPFVAEVPQGSYYFGSYSPSSGSFAYHLAERESPNTNCSLSTLARRLRPALSVSPSRRYVVGMATPDRKIP